MGFVNKAPLENYSNTYIVIDNGLSKKDIGLYEGSEVYWDHSIEIEMDSYKNLIQNIDSIKMIVISVFCCLSFIFFF